MRVYWDDPDVRQIELWCDPQTDRTVLRIRLRDASARARLGLPEKIDGVPVRVIVADYGPEG